MEDLEKEKIDLVKKRAKNKSKLSTENSPAENVGLENKNQVEEEKPKKQKGRKKVKIDNIFNGEPLIKSGENLATKLDKQIEEFENLKGKSEDDSKDAKILRLESAEKKQLSAPKERKLIEHKSKRLKVKSPKEKKLLMSKETLVAIAPPKKQKLLEKQDRKKIDAPIEKLLLETFVKVKNEYETNKKKKEEEKEKTKREKSKSSKSRVKKSKKSVETEKLGTNQKSQIGEENTENLINLSKNIAINDENSSKKVLETQNVSQETIKNNEEKLDDLITNNQAEEQDKNESKNTSKGASENENSQNLEINDKTTNEVSDKKEKVIKKRVLLVTSESQPFCATGGLADVTGSLPKYIMAEDDEIDVRTILPLYSNISYYYRCQFRFLGYIYVTLAWRKEYCGVFEYDYNGVKYYFIDNEQYFKRDAGVYGYFDDAERFAFFSKAVLEVLPMLGFFPDIIHANDWQTALIPIYLKTIAWDERYYHIKTILTIHNIQYQGRFSSSVLVDVFGIDERYKNLLTYDNDVNVLKGGIVCADKLTTVSPTYAEEIKSPEYGGGLHGIVIENAYKLTGILNGLDYDFYNPATDDVIFARYSKDSLNNKVLNKAMLQKEFHLEENLSKPIVAFCSRMTFLKGFEMIKNCIEKLINECDFEFVGVGSGDREYEDFFRYLNSKYPNKVHISVGYSLELGRKIYAGADIYIMPSVTEPCGLSQLVACRYGVVPIVRETGGLKDTIRDFGNLGGGNGYTFKEKNTADFEYSIRRAVNDYYDKPNWTKKVEKVMSLDFSWKNTAKKYIEVYYSL